MQSPNVIHHRLNDLSDKYANGAPEYHDGDTVCVGCEGDDYGYGAICTSHAEYIATHENGLVCGFMVEDNPCEIGELADGHDFALIEGRYIVDTWLYNWEESIDKPVLDMQNPDDSKLIRRFYGDPDKWERHAPSARNVMADQLAAPAPK